MGEYTSWYSVQDEAFLSDRQVVASTDANGKTVHRSAESGHVVVRHTEENYLFALPRMASELRTWLASPQGVGLK